jgi:osmoprotectant transport system permease protein
MSALLELAWTDRWNLLLATAAHLDLVIESLFFAVILGVPMGVFATRSRQLERAILGLANILQTVPSLALIGLLFILFHGQLGKPPARAALVLYAILPIVKNTILGLRSIDPAVSEAALGMGMTGWQRLTIVELPLAIPIILGGVRVAAVASVGMATIAATIGARNLGSYIFRGIQLFDSRQILLGSIPAAILALACDAALGEIELVLDPKQPKHSRLGSIAATLAVLALLAFGAFGAWVDWRGSRGVRIGSKDSAEPVLLGHMLADLVEARTGLVVERTLYLGGTLVCYTALEKGGLDAYVEYTGTALTTILHEPPRNDPSDVYKTVCTGLEHNGVVCLDPLGFENTFAILMTRKRARELGITRISDLRSHPDLVPGFGPEFRNRPDGYPGLAKAYRLNFRNDPREMDRNLLYEALVQGTVDVAAGDSTDGRVAALDLVQLVDDLRYFPPYQAVPLANAKALGQYPKLREALNGLAGKLDAATMRKLNHEVDGLRRDPAQVARQFLIDAGLLKR